MSAGSKSSMRIDGSSGYQHIVCLHRRNLMKVGLSLPYLEFSVLKGIKKLGVLCRQLVNLFIPKKNERKEDKEVNIYTVK